MLPRMVRFEPSREDLELLKDGGVAIIDQWICSHARSFSRFLSLCHWHVFFTDNSFHNVTCPFVFEVTQHHNL